MIENAYKIDLVIEDKVIAEIKSVIETHPIFQAQLLIYLKLTRMKLGLLINFNHRLLNMEFTGL